MAKTKTTYTGRDISEFLDEFVVSLPKKEESYQLIKLFQDWSGWEAKMWGPSIIGFGNYHYTYASGHEGDAPVIAFSPRKAAFSLYVYAGTEKSQSIVKNLGKFKMGKACIYVKKLSDIHLEILQQLCEDSIAYIRSNHQCGSCQK